MNAATHRHASTNAPHSDSGASAPYRVYGEGDDLYASMLADTGRTRNVVRLESYIFAGDEIGWQFAAALAE